MPYDGGQYPGFGGSSPHKALLIMPNGVHERAHSLHRDKTTRLLKTWADMAPLFSAPHNYAEPHEVYVAAARHVFGDTLERYRGHISIAGIEKKLLAELFQQTNDMLCKNITFKALVNYPLPVEVNFKVGDCYFPRVMADLLEKNEPFHAYCLDHGDVYFGKAEPDRQKPKTDLILHYQTPLLR